MRRLISVYTSMGYGARHGLRKAALTILLISCTIPAARAEQITIAALGDSLTQGYGLAPEDGLVPQLEGWLRAQGADVRVINAGVSGDTTAGGRARIDWTLSDGVDALIVTLGGNDTLRAVPPAETRANLDAILTRAGDLPTLLVGVRAPSNYGPDYKAEFDAIYPALAAKHDVPLFADIMGPIRDHTDQATALRTLMQADGLHPNTQGVTLIVNDLGPRVLDLIRTEQKAP